MPRSAQERAAVLADQAGEVWLPRPNGPAVPVPAHWDGWRWVIPCGEVPTGNGLPVGPPGYCEQPMGHDVTDLAHRARVVVPLGQPDGGHAYDVFWTGMPYDVPVIDG